MKLKHEIKWEIIGLTALVMIVMALLGLGLIGLPIIPEQQQQQYIQNWECIQWSNISLYNVVNNTTSFIFVQDNVSINEIDLVVTECKRLTGNCASNKTDDTYQIYANNKTMVFSDCNKWMQTKVKNE